MARARWYAVKTVYRVYARGRARRIDADYDPEATLVEERVVLFRAKSFADAIRKGEREARRYATEGGGWITPYGQEPVTKYLEACDAYVLASAPGDGREVYSRTEIVSSRVSTDEVADRLLGAEGSRPDRRRWKFDIGGWPD